MKITRNQLRQLIIESMGDDYSYDDYGSGIMQKSNLRRSRRGTSREESGEYRPRFDLPAPEVKLSNNASLALQRFGYPWQEFGSTMSMLEKMHGEVVGFSMETGDITFYNRATGQEVIENIHEVLR
jgi:hypothetical protein